MKFVSRQWPYLAVAVISLVMFFIVCNAAPAQCGTNGCSIGGSMKHMVGEALASIGEGPLAALVRHRPHLFHRETCQGEPQALFPNRPHFFRRRGRGCSG